MRIIAIGSNLSSFSIEIIKLSSILHDDQTTFEDLPSLNIWPNSSDILIARSFYRLSGIMKFWVGLPSILWAIASAARTFISSVITFILCSVMALNIPGKAKESLIWF